MYASMARERAELNISRMRADGILTINGSYLRELPVLPEGVRELHLKNSSITSITALPDTLEVLNLYNNNFLTSLPSSLPPRLRVLKVSVSALTSLPSPLPVGLQILDCGYNKISELPELPSTLQELICNGSNPMMSDSNPITQLPRLPETLLKLSCSGNKLGSTRENYEGLPPLPKNLLELNCAENFIHSLPELPPRLRILKCENNSIRVIPFLPASLIFINFNYNPLQKPYSLFWQKIVNLGFSEYVKDFYRDAFARRGLEEFKQAVNEYFPIYQAKTRGKDLAAFQQTIGRKGATSHEIPIPHMLNKKYGVPQIIGEMLTGKEGELNTQRVKLIGNLPPRVGGRKKTLRKKHTKYRNKRTRKTY